MARGIKKVMHGGNLEAFNKFLTAHRDNGSNFKVSSSGLSRMVTFDSGKKFRFFGQGKAADNTIKGVYFVSMVRNSIDKYIEKYGIAKKRDKVIAQTFNVESISKVLGKPVACLDLNLCYWRTAFLLGYIDFELYKKGIESGHKRGMLVSIGALNKNPLIQHFENGKEVSKSFDSELNGRYSPFYWQVIGKVNDLMMEVYRELGDDFYMWLTDCAFVSNDRINDVIAIFDKYGFPHKFYTSDFESVDMDFVKWFDCKEARFKSMSIGGRHIKPLYGKWKYQHNFDKNTILEVKN